MKEYQRAKTRGESMRDARKKAGLSLDALAVKCGLPKSTIWRLEIGCNNGNIVTIELIAEAAGACAKCRLKKEKGGECGAQKRNRNLPCSRNTGKLDSLCG